VLRIQQQMRPGLAVSNGVPIANGSALPGHGQSERRAKRYSPSCITDTSRARLLVAAANQICGLYDINRGLGQVKQYADERV